MQGPFCDSEVLEARRVAEFQAGRASTWLVSGGSGMQTEFSLQNLDWCCKGLVQICGSLELFMVSSFRIP